MRNFPPTICVSHANAQKMNAGFLKIADIMHFAILLRNFLQVFESIGFSKTCVQHAFGILQIAECMPDADKGVNGGLCIKRLRNDFYTDNSSSALLDNINMSKILQKQQTMHV